MLRGKTSNCFHIAKLLFIIRVEIKQSNNPCSEINRMITIFIVCCAFDRVGKIPVKIIGNFLNFWMD